MIELIHADCREVLTALDPNSVDAVVTDPPYGLEFMGKDWDAPWRTGGQKWANDMTESADWNGRQRSRQGNAYPRSKHKRCRICGRQEYSGSPCTCDAPDWEYIMAAPAQLRAFQAWCETWAVECLRVLKPGGYLLAFGGARTFHRLTCALEDAGFEIRDCLSWNYGSGFPKSLDVGKAIDKAAGAEREVVGRKDVTRDWSRNGERGDFHMMHKDLHATTVDVTAPATPEAQQWNGWGTALKPAWEPIIMARKPLEGTVAGNVLKWGTGAINVDGCRIEGQPWTPVAPNAGGRSGGIKGKPAQHPGGDPHPAGRWPANVALDPEAAAMLDEQSGERSYNPPATWRSDGDGTSGEKTYGRGVGARQSGDERSGFGDRGGASRFFYCAKASKRERGEYNKHPTVKPIALMRWLVRMVTQPGGTVVDPFAGSGSTGIACSEEGLRAILIDADAESIETSRRRLTDRGAVLLP